MSDTNTIGSACHDSNGAKNIDYLTTVLRCVKCYHHPLLITSERHQEWASLKLDLHQQSYKCPLCNALYPITSDFIPIMWSENLRGHFLSGDERKITDSLSANSYIYDKISDVYLKHTRGNAKIKKRVTNAVNKLLTAMKTTEQSKDRRKTHLDVGCGPGHMLVWLKKFNFYQVGVDVSLVNLRTTRKLTGAYVLVGDATNLPFNNNVFDIVTEGSVLHHVEDWRSFIKEACRSVTRTGTILLDSEPTSDSKSWSFVAKFIFELRYPVYKALSFFSDSKLQFRDIGQAKLNADLAEIHNQPGKGFNLNEISGLFEELGFDASITVSPDENLNSVANTNLKHALIHLLSLHNPWNPKYGDFTVLAVARNNYTIDQDLSVKSDKK